MTGIWASHLVIIAVRRNTILFDQVNNFFHDHIFEMDQRWLCRDEATDLSVNDRLVTKFDKGLHRRLNLIDCHAARGHEKGKDDGSEVHDIAHHIADVLATVLVWIIQPRCCNASRFRPRALCALSLRPVRT